MAYRPYVAFESLTEVSTTATTYTDLVTGTFAAADQAASATYALFWSGQGQINATTVDYRLRLMIDGAQTILCNVEAQENASPIDYDAHAGIVFITTASTPVDITLALQVAAETGGNTAKAKNGRLALLKLGSNDKFATSTPRVTTTSTTYQDTACSITFTPGGTGDYYLIGTALIDVGNSVGACKIRLSDGTNNSLDGTGIRAVKDTTNRFGALTLWKVTGVSGSKTYRIQYNSDEGDGATAGASEMRLLILRASDFDASFYSILGADDAGTQTTYQSTGASQTFTPSGNPHLTIATSRFGGDTNTISNYVQYLDGADVVYEAMREPTAVDGRYASAAHRVATYPATSRTQVVQRKGESTSTESFVSDGTAILTLDLGASTPTITPPLLSNSNAFYGSTVAPGAVTLAPPVMANTSVLYGPTVAQGVQALGAPLLTNASTIYAATVTAGGLTLSPGQLASSSTIYAAVVVRGTLTLGSGILANTSTLPSPTVSLFAGDQSLAPARLSNTNVFFPPTVTRPSLQVLTPARSSNASVMYLAAVTQPDQPGTYPLAIKGGGSVVRSRLAGGGAVMAAFIPSTGRVIATALKGRP
jgi:hypothetical protein